MTRPREKPLGRRWPAGCLVILLILAGLAGANTAPGRTITPADQLGLADHFFQDGDYDRAITEYARFVYFFPQLPQNVYARYQIALAYFKSGQYEKACRRFETLLAEESGEACRREAAFMVSRCYLALGRRRAAVANLKAWLSGLKTDAQRDKAYYEIGWIYLRTAEPPAALDFAHAREYFQKISPAGRQSYDVDKLLAALSDRQPSAGRSPVSRKSPALAGGLGLWPGAGYVYCGRFQDALVSFLFNAGLMYAAYEAFEQEHYALGAVVSLVDVGFYAGSIYGSVNAARKYNRQQVKQAVSRLGNWRVGIFPADEEGGVACALKIPF